MQCIITSIEKTQTFPRLVTVTLPTKTGVVQIKKGHAEYFVEVIAGEVSCITTAGKRIDTSIEQGVCHVQDNTVTVLI